MIVQLGYIRSKETGERRPVYFQFPVGDNERFIPDFKLYDLDDYSIDTATGKMILPEGFVPDDIIEEKPPFMVEDNIEVVED